MIITGNEVEAVYQELTASLKVEAELITDMVGSQPASEDGIRAFVTHQLKLSGQEADKAVENILTREVGERDKRPPEGELTEVESYAVNVIRRTAYGPYIGDWMLKACIKQAASRCGLFKKKIGTKGDFVEGGRVYAMGSSNNGATDDIRKIFLYKNGNPAPTFYRKFFGKVSTPQGSKSITHDSECVKPGTRFAFEYRFMRGKTNKEEVLSILALMCNTGVGSAKPFECGKFKIIEADLEI